MTVDEFIDSQPAERHALLHVLHEIIRSADSSVKPIVEPMMGKDMIVYKQGGFMKYALAGVKNYMSLHCLPIYIDATLYDKYKGLFPDARVQKGCVNFTTAEAMPVGTVKNLIEDSATVSIPAFMESRKKPKAK